MIGKPITGRSFGGCIRYVLNRQEAKILAAEGVRMQDAASLTKDFNLQRQIRPELGKAVGHLVLSWSPEDEPKLSDEVMTERAKEYLEKAGIRNTQYVIVRHSDREHPHLHLIYNRVDNNGKTISDKNNFAKNIKACKEITLKYGYHLGKDKGQVNRQALRGKEKTRYELYDAITSAMSTATTMKELEAGLKQSGITVEYKYRGGTTAVQGLSFQKGNVKIKGSAIDRSLSYGRIQNRLDYNRNIQLNSERLGIAEVTIQPGIHRFSTRARNLKAADMQHATNNSSGLLNALLKTDDYTGQKGQENNEGYTRKRKKKRRNITPGNS